MIMTTFPLTVFIIIQIGLLEYCHSKYGEKHWSFHLTLQANIMGAQISILIAVSMRTSIKMC